MRDAAMMAQIQSLVGAQLDGRYQIVSVIGHGGMGVVYRGVHMLMNVPVAIKMILGGADEMDISRFRREAQAVSLLKHPHIVAVRDFGLVQNVYPYMVMDLVDGPGLDKILRTHGARPYKAAVPLFCQLADALNHAHRKGVIHRDLKPSNVMIVAGDEGAPHLYVLDFGLAKVDAPDGEMSRLTQTGAVMGTPYYMSPEQCLGQKVDHRSDIYAVGCIMYEVVSGQLAVSGENFLQILNAHINSRAPALPAQIPAELSRIIFKAMNKNPDDRYQNLADLKTDLQSFLSGAAKSSAAVSQAAQQSSAPAAVPASMDSATVLPSAMSSMPNYSSLNGSSRPRPFAATPPADYDHNTHVAVPLKLPLLPDSSERTPDDEEMQLIQAVQAAEAKSGANSPESYAALALLAKYLDKKDYLAESRSAYERVLSAALKSFGPQSRAVAEAYEMLAGLASAMHDWRDSVYYHSWAIKCLSGLEDEPSMDRARLHHGIYVAFTWLDSNDLADDQLQKALEICRSHQPDYAFRLAEWLMAAAAFYLREYAEAFLLEAIAVIEQAYGDNSPDLVKPLTKLGVHYAIEDRFNDGEPVFRRAMNLAYKLLDPMDEQLATTAYECGLFYLNNKHFDKASKCLNKSMEIRRQLFGEQAQPVAEVWSLLGRVAEGTGDRKKGIELYKRAYAIVRGGDNLDLQIEYLQNLGWALEEEGALPAAEAELSRAADVAKGYDYAYKKILAVKRLGEFYSRVKRYLDAERILLSVKEMQIEAFGNDDEELIDTWIQLKGVYENLGRMPAVAQAKSEIARLEKL